jgi:hypothetical protein
MIAATPVTITIHSMLVILALILSIFYPKFGDTTADRVLEIALALVLPEVYLLIYLVLIIANK